MYKIVAPLALCIAIATTACSSSNYNKDEVPDVSPQNLYKTAQSAMLSGDYTQAKQYLEAIDSRYPFGDLAEQVQLDLIYVYYKSRESDLTSAQINRFLRLSPTSPNTDYVIYMKGLNEIQKRSDMIQEFIGLNRSQKDPTNYYEAFKIFKGLIETYPNSQYVADARQRMIFIKQQLAERELKIAEYYFERGAYLSSIRHCQNVLYSYRGTPSLNPSLKLMAKAYDKLNLHEPAENTRRVLAESTNSKYVAEDVKLEEPKQKKTSIWSKLNIFNWF